MTSHFVIYCLKDLELLPDGDMTMVGDRGVALSGGQRARVNLARAVYSDADIYLLDDPLSAVDSAVGHYLFDKCINGLLKPKIRILVTHQLQYLKAATKIILMSKGNIVASGDWQQLEDMGADFLNFLQQTEESYREQQEKEAIAAKRRPMRRSSETASAKSAATATATSSPFKRQPSGEKSDGAVSFSPLGEEVPDVQFRSPTRMPSARKDAEGDSPEKTGLLADFSGDSGREAPGGLKKSDSAISIVSMALVRDFFLIFSFLEILNKFKYFKFF